MRLNFMLFFAAIAFAIFLAGCINPPVCGDNVCEAGIEDNQQLPTYCPADCMHLQTCEELGGKICEPGFDCNGQSLPASDSNSCCLGSCQQMQCFDSDGGINFDENGYVSLQGEKNYDYCSGTKLFEFFCSPSNKVPGQFDLNTIPHDCSNPNGKYCQGGKCVSQIVCGSQASEQLNLKSFGLQGLRSSIPVSLEFSQNSEIDISSIAPLLSSKVLSGIELGLQANLKKNTGFARVVLVDKSGKEYLAFGSDNILPNAGNFSISNICEETCLASGITPSKLRIELQDASLRINSINFSIGRTSQAQISERKALQAAEKLDAVRQRINENNSSWIAGETRISQLSYSEKKKLFGGKLPNLNGFEYYKGGVFDALPEKSNENQVQGEPEPSIEFLLPAKFDWRDAHDENWITPIKNQLSCGSCWAFASVGAMEGAINAYYNRHLDQNLSEQQVVSCSGAGGCNGGYSAFEYFKESGIADSSCFLYSASDLPCSQMCVDWQSRAWKITDANLFAQTIYQFKRMLIEKGPLYGGVNSWSHAMAAVGYDTNENGSTIAIFKNSWGSDWGENGFVRLKLDLRTEMGFEAIQNPIIQSQSLPWIQVNCQDNDNDKLCNWGTGQKPANCPASCGSLRDIDDSNAGIGALHTFNNVCGDGILAGLDECEIIGSGSLPQANSKFCKNPEASCSQGTYAFPESGLGACQSGCFCSQIEMNFSDCSTHCSCPTGQEPYCTMCEKMHCQDQILNCGEATIDDCAGN